MSEFKWKVSMFNRKLQKELEVFRSDNMKIRIQHIKIYKFITKKVRCRWVAAKLNENRPQNTTQWRIDLAWRSMTRLSSWVPAWANSIQLFISPVPLAHFPKPLRVCRSCHTWQANSLSFQTFPWHPSHPTFHPRPCKILPQTTINHNPFQ